MAAVVIGNKTGCHLNFGVTLGVYIQKGLWRKNIKALFIYAIAELCGAYFGMTVSLIVLGKENITLF